MNLCLDNKMIDGIKKGWANKVEANGLYMFPCILCSLVWPRGSITQGFTGVVYKRVRKVLSATVRITYCCNVCALFANSFVDPSCRLWCSAFIKETVCACGCQGRHTFECIWGVRHLHFQIGRKYRDRFNKGTYWGHSYFLEDGEEGINPHLYWADGPNRVTCFEAKKKYKKGTITYPFPCR